MHQSVQVDFPIVTTRPHHPQRPPFRHNATTFDLWSGQQQIIKSDDKSHHQQNVYSIDVHDLTSVTPSSHLPPPPSPSPPTDLFHYNTQQQFSTSNTGRSAMCLPPLSIPPKCTCCRRQISVNSPSHDLSWRRLHMSRAKLKATATTSELLSGFAMIAMVELQINEPTNVPEWLFVMFAVCTTVLVAVHIFALMISTYLLPNIDAIAKLEVCEMVAESPHERMRGFIQLAWAFSTVLGLFLFLVEVAILCWVKFWDYSFNAAIASTVVVIPVLIIFILFAVHFYHSLVVYKCNTSYNDMAKLEDMKKQLDEITNQI